MHGDIIQLIALLDLVSLTPAQNQHNSKQPVSACTPARLWCEKDNCASSGQSITATLSRLRQDIVQALMKGRDEKHMSVDRSGTCRCRHGRVISTSLPSIRICNALIETREDED